MLNGISQALRATPLLGVLFFCTQLSGCIPICGEGGSGGTYTVSDLAVTALDSTSDTPTSLDELAILLSYQQVFAHTSALESQLRTAGQSISSFFISSAHACSPTPPMPSESYASVTVHAVSDSGSRLLSNSDFEVRSSSIGQDFIYDETLDEVRKTTLEEYLLRAQGPGYLTLSIKPTMQPLPTNERLEFTVELDNGAILTASTDPVTISAP